MFHEGEDFQWLEKMLKHPDMQYIGLSPHTETKSSERFRFCKECFKRIYDIRPEVKTHGFGLTVLDILPYFNFTSVDSTTWSMLAIHGRILLLKNNKLYAVPVSDRTVHDSTHFCHYSTQVKTIASAYIEQLGFSTERLLTLSYNSVPTGIDTHDITDSITARQQFNAVSMMTYLHDADYLTLPKSIRKIF